MGLDMCLYASRYISGFNHSPAEEKTLSKNVAEAVFPEFSKLERDDFTPASVTVQLQIAYWRKANAIHAWFVRECGGGRDECQEIYLEVSKLEELVQLCRTVLEDKSLASELLPSQSGFFFGSTDYDEDYFADLQDTIDQLSPIISVAKKQREKFDAAVKERGSDRPYVPLNHYIYRASW